MGMHKTYITIEEDIYTGATAGVHMGNQISEEIPVKRGVRQGDPISPKLFTATIQLGEKGINIDGKKCRT